MTVQEVAAVAAGGALGAVARHVILTRAAVMGEGRGVVAVLVVNLAACALLGTAVGTLSGAWLLAAGTGLAGALSTFSTLALQLTRLVREGRRVRAAGLAVATLAGGLLMLALGGAAAAALRA